LIFHRPCTDESDALHDPQRVIIYILRIHFKEIFNFTTLRKPQTGLRQFRSRDFTIGSRTVKSCKFQ
jgi:hypothetical protein